MLHVFVLIPPLLFWSNTIYDMENNIFPKIRIESVDHAVPAKGVRVTRGNGGGNQGDDASCKLPDFASRYEAALKRDPDIVGALAS